MSCYQSIQMQHCGDRNRFSVTPLINGIPRLQQIVTKNTCNGKILDVLLTNVAELYNVPEIIPPVLPDDPLNARPSDHSTILAKPISSLSPGLSVNSYTTRTVRPLPQSGVLQFGKWIMNEKWDNLKNETKWLLTIVRNS